MQTALLHHLHELLLQCWEEGTVPQDMHDASIITLYKNKGDCSDCNNYPGISILSIVGMAFACMVLNRLQVFAEHVYPKAQCGFRVGRLTINIIISWFTHACTEFGLTISLKKTNIMGKDLSSIPNISIGNYILEVVEVFTYLGSTISSNLSLDAELNTQIGNAVTAMACLLKRVWENSMLTINTKMKVYQACVLSIPLCGSEAWTLYYYQECRLNAFHLCCLRRILGITWQDFVSHKNVQAQVRTLSMFALLTQKCLNWHGHVSHMQDGQIPKDMLYSELTTGSRPAGRPAFCFKDIFK